MGSFKKRFEVVKATKQETFDGVKAGGKDMKFGRSGGFIIDDAGVAKEIQQTEGYGHNALGKGGSGRVVVMETEDHRVEDGHNYTFSMRGVPWARYSELGKRIREGDPDGQADVPSAQEAQEESVRLSEEEEQQE